MFGTASSTFTRGPMRKALIPLAATVPAAAMIIHSQAITKHVEELETIPVVRYRPPSIEQLCSTTKFCRRELQIMYRAFKQCCPNGTVLLSEFQDIYTQFFPQGNAAKYAELVFRTFDRDNDGIICFEEFVLGLSVISRGTVLEKLEWIFSLYDICRRGSIGYNELLQVVRSIYELLGSAAIPPVSSSHVRAHVTELFSRMDRDHDGQITKEEFVEMCQQDDSLCASLALFDTKM